MASLCIGLDGWLLGGLIFDGLPTMKLSVAIFVPGFTSLLTPSFIPATACFSLLYPTVLSVLMIILAGISHMPYALLYPTVLLVLMIILAGISHMPWQTARLSLTLASSTASWYLYTFWARSCCLIASSISTKNLLWASFAQPPWPRILLHTLTCAPKMQYTNALIDWFMHARPACVNLEAVFGANQSYCGTLSGSM